jgi:hypothetical protein
MLRSVLSVLGGFAAIFVMVMVSTIFLARAMLGTRSREDMMNVKPTPAFTWANLIASAVIAVVGGFLTGAMAPRLPLHHAGALAGLMAFMALFSFFVSRGSTAPRWYNLALMVVGPAGAVLGGYLKSR